MDTRIKILMAVQIIALPLATALASNYPGPNPAFAVLVSLIFSEAGLLGLWAAFGKSRPWVRLVCFSLGLTCLSIAIPIAERGDEWLNDFKNLLVTGLIVALPALLVYLTLRKLQRSRGLRLVRSPPLQTTSEGFQFSIKDLMAVTAIVAAIISIRKGLRNLDDGSQTWFDLATAVAVIVPCVLVVELATFWAALGLSRPFPRLMVVVSSGILVGIVPPFFFLNGMGWEFFVFWSEITGFQALLTTATLLVFRSCGWRLCRATSDENLIPSADSISIEETESSLVFDA